METMMVTVKRIMMTEVGGDCDSDGSANDDDDGGKFDGGCGDNDDCDDDADDNDGCDDHDHDGDGGE